MTATSPTLRSAGGHCGPTGASHVDAGADVFSKPARRFVPLGMLAAAMAMVWAVSVSSQVDEAMAASDDTELSW